MLRKIKNKHHAATTHSELHSHNAHAAEQTRVHSDSSKAKHSLGHALTANHTCSNKRDSSHSHDATMQHMDSTQTNHAHADSKQQEKKWTMHMQNRKHHSDTSSHKQLSDSTNADMQHHSDNTQTNHAHTDNNSFGPHGQQPERAATWTESIQHIANLHMQHTCNTQQTSLQTANMQTIQHMDSKHADHSHMQYTYNNTWIELELNVQQQQIDSFFFEELDVQQEDSNQSFGPVHTCRPAKHSDSHM
ncbi:hypothetical protein I3843_03G125700 [Carya illinoinensis]|nr:hypothetical protein I3843_03G125700 [Carya illinoinensis]